MRHFLVCWTTERFCFNPFRNFCISYSSSIRTSSREKYKIWLIIRWICLANNDNETITKLIWLFGGGISNMRYRTDSECIPNDTITKHSAIYDKIVFNSGLYGLSLHSLEVRGIDFKPNSNKNKYGTLSNIHLPYFYWGYYCIRNIYPWYKYQLP